MKLNKKWIALMLLVCVAFALTACGEKKEEAKAQKGKGNSSKATAKVSDKK